MRLRELQEGMVRALRRPVPLHDLPDERDFAERLARGNARLSPVDQVDIYREQFSFRHLDALMEDFEAVAEVLGHQAFDEVATKFLSACPPDMVSLNDLGRGFPAYLVAASELPHQPLVGELARLEWAFVEAFFSAEKPALDPKRLEAAAERLDEATIVFDDTLRWFRFTHPVHVLRHAIVREEPWELPAARPCAVVVYRQNLVLGWKEVDDLSLAALEALATGEPLAVALDRVADERPDDADRLEASVGAFFRAWVEDGWIRDVRLPEKARPKPRKPKSKPRAPAKKPRR